MLTPPMSDHEPARPSSTSPPLGISPAPPASSRPVLPPLYAHAPPAGQDHWDRVGISRSPSALPAILDDGGERRRAGEKRGRDSDQEGAGLPTPGSGVAGGQQQQPSSSSHRGMGDLRSFSLAPPDPKRPRIPHTSNSLPFRQATPAAPPNGSTNPSSGASSSAPSPAPTTPGVNSVSFNLPGSAGPSSSSFAAPGNPAPRPRSFSVAPPPPFDHHSTHDESPDLETDELADAGSEGCGPRQSMAGGGSEQGAARRARSARKRACDECARAKARCKVEMPAPGEPMVCTRCRVYGHDCILPEGFVAEPEEPDSPGKLGIPRRTAQKPKQRRMSIVESVNDGASSARTNPASLLPSPPPQQPHAAAAVAQPSMFPHSVPLPQFNAFFPNSHLGLQAFSGPSPMDVAFLNAEMTAFPFLRNLANYDINRLMQFIGAAARVGLGTITLQQQQQAQQQAQQQQQQQHLHQPPPPLSTQTSPQMQASRPGE